MRFLKMENWRLFASISNPYKTRITSAPECHKLRLQRSACAGVCCILFRNEVQMMLRLHSLFVPFMAIHSQPTDAESSRLQAR
jgi:hypothetical protein